MAEQGVDRAKFEAAYQSFSVATQVRQAIQLQDQYQVEGTPAMGIAGRYYTDGSMAGGFERMIQITNQLIEQSANARKACSNPIVTAAQARFGGLCCCCCRVTTITRKNHA